MSQRTRLDEYFRRQDDFEQLKKYIRSAKPNVGHTAADVRDFDYEVLNLRRDVDRLKRISDMGDTAYDTGHGLYITKDRRYVRNPARRYMY